MTVVTAKLFLEKYFDLFILSLGALKSIRLLLIYQISFRDTQMIVFKNDD